MFYYEIKDFVFLLILICFFVDPYLFFLILVCFFDPPPTKSENQEKKQGSKKQNRGFHSKTGRTETSPGIKKKTTSDSKLTKTYGNLEGQKKTKYCVLL